MMNIDDMLTFDRVHIWHPYTSMTNPLPTYPVVSAEGVRFKLADGRELIDGMASWWCVIHGYNHPVLNAAAKEQLDRMSHVMFGGITHPQAVELAEKLVRLSPETLDKVFFCDSGSVSVEVAIKMAIQYWNSLDRPEKNRLLTIRSGYHGDTFGAMAVCDPVTGMHHMFSGVLQQHYFADVPQCRNDDEWSDDDIASMAELLEQHHAEIAAVILEPVVQGAGGMRFYAPEYLRQLRKLCDEFDVLLIFDEIATGFGRSGKFFAAEHADVAPDIMCVGKAITGGYMSFAATLAMQKISDGIGRKHGGVFMHGPTFMANPLACAVANASIDLLLMNNWSRNVTRIGNGLRTGLAPCKDMDAVADVRVLGAIGVVELHEPVEMATIQKAFVERGIWVRPFGKLVYVMPAYIMSDDDLYFLCRNICDVVSESSGS